jgi:hypothetical protein
MAYFAIESSESNNAVETALNASFSSLAAKGQLDESSTSSKRHQNAVKQIKIKTISSLFL